MFVGGAAAGVLGLGYANMMLENLCTCKDGIGKCTHTGLYLSVTIHSKERFIHACMIYIRASRVYRHMYVCRWGVGDGGGV